MKLDLKFDTLIRLRNKMRAQEVFWRPSTVVLNPRQEIQVQLREGIEITLQDVKSGPAKLLTYKDEQVILYIKDTQTDRYTLENQPEKSRRFHIAECETLANMRDKGRFERYVVTTRNDGKFKVDWLDRDNSQRGETEAALKVCKHCLKEMNWRGYDDHLSRLQLSNGSKQTKDDIWSEFSISEFLMEFSTFFVNLPSRVDTTAELNIYGSQWAEVSESTRKQKNWTCEECGVNLRTAPNLLHCHHKNGVVTDNSPKNLSVLCAIDHAAQPDHNHMHIPFSTKQKILKLRVEQGIKDVIL